jgi:hypothetical protein
MTIIRTDGTTKQEPFPNTRTLEVLQKAVGGYIEIVYLHGENEGELLIVNEEGLNLGLPHNAKASLLAGQGIVGTAILLEMKEAEGL